MTAPPVPLVAGTGLELFPQVVLAHGDVGHNGDPLLGQHSPGGGERLNAAPRDVCYTLRQ